MKSSAGVLDWVSPSPSPTIAESNAGAIGESLDGWRATVKSEQNDTAATPRLTSGLYVSRFPSALLMMPSVRC